MMRRVILKFVAGCVLSPLGFICFGAFHDILYATFGVESFFGGDKASGFCGLFLGVPIGAIVGISLVDKLVLKSQGYNILGVVVGFVVSQFGIVLGLFLIDKAGNKTIPLSLFITILLCLIGYHIKFLLTKALKRQMS